MPNQNILYIIPYIILGSFSLILAYKNFAGKTNRDQVWISFLLILGASWAFFQFFEFLSIGIKGKIFWDSLSWIPIAFIPAFYFLFNPGIDRSIQAEIKNWYDIDWNLYLHLAINTLHKRNSPLGMERTKFG